MTRRNQLLLGVAILGLGLALAARGAPPANEVSELKVTIREWDVPTKGAHPHDPAVGADGALWFTEQMANKLGRLDPVTGTFKEYPLKLEDSGPHGLVADRDGNIWFTGNFKGYIGKLRFLILRSRIPTRPSLIAMVCCGSRSKHPMCWEGWIPAQEKSS